MHRFEDKGNLPVEMEGIQRASKSLCNGKECAHRTEGDFKERRRMLCSGTERKDRLIKDFGQPEPWAV